MSIRYPSIDCFICDGTKIRINEAIPVILPLFVAVQLRNAKHGIVASLDEGSITDRYLLTLLERYDTLKVTFTLVCLRQ